MPLPVTEAIVPPAPKRANAKSVVSTPVTILLNVTANCTLAALVGLAPRRAIERATGGSVSIVKTSPEKLPLVALKFA